MKKIVALVLALALALSLCTVAFAATEPVKSVVDYDVFNAADDEFVASPCNLVKHSAVAQTKDANKGTIAYYTLVKNDAPVVKTDVIAAGDKFVKVTDSEDADLVVYKTGKGDVAFYLAKLDNGADYMYATAVTKLSGMIGDKCEQYDIDEDIAGDVTFYSYKDKAGDVQIVYSWEDTDVETFNLLVNGELVAVVNVDDVNSEYTAEEHDWEEATYNADETKVKTYKCADCGKVATVITNKASTPDGAKYLETYKAWYMPNTLTAAAATTTTTVDSSKTFDAGVAMYVGLSLMSVAGSAVVIGKKKEF